MEQYRTTAIDTFIDRQNTITTIQYLNIILININIKNMT